MEPPEELTCKQSVFERTGRAVSFEAETFGIPNCFAICTGHHRWPQCCEPLVDVLESAALVQHFGAMCTNIRRLVDTLPGHADCVRKALNHLPV